MLNTLYNVFVAFADECELGIYGVFDTLEKAKQCVEDNDPRYNTSVTEYNVITGKPVRVWNWFVNTFTSSAAHWNDGREV